MNFKVLAAVGLLVCAGSAWAADLVVERVQLPAWVERGSRIQPLTPGMELRRNDVVHTGSGARLLLRMNDGSSVKLGEKAQLSVNELGADEADNSLFRAALNVLTGAFRYTTDAVAKPRRRDVTVRIATVTVGIRGTDLWGKAADDKDIVCLIEGHVQVNKDGYTPVDMKDPNSFYIAPRQGDPLPVAPVPPEKLAQWSTETEVAAGQAVLQDQGRWTLGVVKVRTQADALAWYDKLRAAGYPARMRQLAGGWQVRISGLADEEAARRLAERLQQEFGASQQEIRRN